MTGPTPPHAVVRRSYDAVAAEYAAEFRDELAAKPLDRALLASLAEQAGPGAPVADLGCGPGHIAGWLARHGSPATGIDLSPEMIAVARADHPEATFRVGDLLSLPAADGEFGAAVAFYSIIHLAPSELPVAFQEIRRVLRPGGLFLAAFHNGTEVRHKDDWFGHEVDLDFRFLKPDAVVAALAGAGLSVEMRMERVAYSNEGTLRAYLLARRQDH